MGESLNTAEALARLRQLTAARDRDALPGVWVGAIWDTYATVFPPEEQGDLRNALTPEHVDAFFDFIRLLTELDLDFNAVKHAAAGLHTAIDRYEAVRREVQAGWPGERHLHFPRRDHDRTKHHTRDMDDAMFLATSTLMRSCLSVRSAGSPLYYTWLRHSASMENGLRRLMNFRKTIHYFDGECKKQRRAVRRHLSGFPAMDRRTGSDDAQFAKLVEETRIWQGRHNDVRLLDRAISYLFHDFLARSISSWRSSRGTRRRRRSSSKSCPRSLCTRSQTDCPI